MILQLGFLGGVNFGPLFKQQQPTAYGGLSTPRSVYDQSQTAEQIRKGGADLNQFLDNNFQLFLDLDKARSENNISEIIRLETELKANQASARITEDSYNSIVNMVEDKIASGTFSRQKPKELKASLVGDLADMGLQALKAGVSIGQVAKARTELGRLQAPTAPEAVSGIPQLETQIEELKQKAAGDFPQRESERERNYAESLASAQRTATQYGVPGAALQQAAQIEASKAKSRDRLSDEQLRMRYQGMVNQLQQLKLGEQARLDQAKQREFYQFQAPQFRTEAAGLAGLERTGIENLFGTLEGIPSRIPRIAQTYGDLKSYIDFQEQQKRQGLPQEGGLYNLPQGDIYGQ